MLSQLSGLPRLAPSRMRLEVVSPDSGLASRCLSLSVKARVLLPGLEAVFTRFTVRLRPQVQGTTRGHARWWALAVGLRFRVHLPYRWLESNSIWPNVTPLAGAQRYPLAGACSTVAATTSCVNVLSRTVGRGDPVPTLAATNKTRVKPPPSHRHVLSRTVGRGDPVPTAATNKQTRVRPPPSQQ
jgi:hypothetical protein